MIERAVMSRLVKTLMFAAVATSCAQAHGQPLKNNPPPGSSPATTSPARYDRHKLVRAHIESAAQLQFMNSIGAVPMNCVPGPGEMDFVVPPGSMDQLRNSGIAAQVTIDDVQPLIDASVNRMRTQAGNQALAGASDANWFDDYKTYPQINAYLNSLAALRPDLASVITVGTSYENRTIYGLRINSANGPAVKPAMLFDGCQHAREWIAAMVPVYIADQLVRTYDTDAAVRAVVDNLEIFIVPVVNVDGYEYTYAVNGNRLWRKNRRDNGNSSFGVDLNRNWGTFWSGPYSASPDSTSDLYYGTSPFSEPEAAALRNLIIAHPNIRGHIDFHSYGQLILEPWSGQFAPPVDDCDILDSLGATMNTGIFRVHATPYSNGWGGHLLYLASGVIPDWCYSVRNILSYTIEVRDTGVNGFLLPPDQILPTGRENFAAALAMANRLMQGVEFTFPFGIPAVVDSGAPQPLAFDAHAITSGPLTANAKMFYRIGDYGPFTQGNVVHLSGDHYQATLPAPPCGKIIQYYFETQAQSGPIYRSPVDAPASLHQSRATSPIVEFNFQTNANWSTGANGAYNGLWQRGIPVASPNWPYDPLADADGSGQCYVTGNVDSTFGDADVDGGSVILVSPALDLANVPGSASAANGGGAVIAYSYFLHLVSTGNDSMTVEISSNDLAGPWTEIVRHAETTGQHWRQHAITQAQLQSLGIPLTSAMRLRFTVIDGLPESIVEGGLDAVKILTACNGSPPCPADVHPQGGNNVVNIDDLVMVIMNWGASGLNAADATHDGVVNIDDLVAVITAWGACQ